MGGVGGLSFLSRPGQFRTSLAAEWAPGHTPPGDFGQGLAFHGNRHRPERSAGSGSTGAG
jgi:hypothetical protein